MSLLWLPGFFGPWAGDVASLSVSSSSPAQTPVFALPWTLEETDGNCELCLFHFQSFHRFVGKCCCKMSPTIHDHIPPKKYAQTVHIHVCYIYFNNTLIISTNSNPPFFWLQSCLKSSKDWYWPGRAPHSWLGSDPGQCPHPCGIRSRSPETLVLSRPSAPETEHWGHCPAELVIQRFSTKSWIGMNLIFMMLFSLKSWTGYL